MRIFQLSLAVAALPAFACGACGCSTHLDWASQGLWSGRGFRLDLRYDYFNQDQLRRGTKPVDRGTLGLPAQGEVQIQTISRVLTLGLDWSPADDWGLTLTAPTIRRTHETYAEGDGEASDSRHAGMGDVRFMGRYLGLSADHSFGIQLGVKLPTGATNETFRGGPRAGQPLDRGLQAGTGTTDILFGMFKFGELANRLDYFAQAQGQVATGSKDGFRPGNAFTFVAGLRRTGHARFTPQIQVNLKCERPETGVNADTANSGATLAYLSPGLEAKLGAGLGLSVFVQLPIYQRVSGLQLEPRALASLSLHYAF